MNARRVIIDVDVGTDDAVAILLFLEADKLEEIKIEAFICTKGNASLDNVCRNLVRLLEYADRTDIPVFRGSFHQILPLQNTHSVFHGNDGFGDLKYQEEPDLNIIKKDIASVGMQNIVSKNPGEISLICLGPLTNAAITMRMFDDFSRNLKDLYIMGGNIHGVGNTTQSAEFNFFIDPEAASIVFDCAQCPIYLLPWETCKSSTITFKWRYEVLGKMGGKLWKLIDSAEKSVYGEPTKQEIWMPCDAFLALSFLHPQKAVVKSRKEHVSIELHGRKTRGQAVLDHLSQNQANAVLIEEVNNTLMKEILMRACQNV